MTDVAHENGLDVIYHGCGNVAEILPDYIEMGIDAMNPLEAKAELDAVDLRRAYGHSLGIAGNSDITVWETGDRDKVRDEVLRKLNAAKGGGYIFMSDHSVTGGVPPKTYHYIVDMVREFGKYPLDLGEYDLDMTS
jgi:uroporphyrinogen-III decarboxylase